ncbi:MAG: hypothetical protein AB9897_01100 [Anaerolineaceae bacterium]
MTPKELLKVCEKAIEDNKLKNTPPSIALNLPAGKGYPKRRRLFGKVGPYGEVLQWGINGMDTVAFDAKFVVSFIKANVREEDLK